MGLRCPKLAVCVHIVPFLWLSGDLNKYARGSLPAFAASLRKVCSEMPSVLPSRSASGSCD